MQSWRNGWHDNTYIIHSAFSAKFYLFIEWHIEQRHDAKSSASDGVATDHPLLHAPAVSVDHVTFHCAPCWCGINAVVLRTRRIEPEVLKYAAQQTSGAIQCKSLMSIYDSVWDHDRRKSIRCGWFHAISITDLNWCPKHRLFNAMERLWLLYWVAFVSRYYLFFYIPVITFSTDACTGRLPRCSVLASTLFERCGLAVTAFAAKRLDLSHRLGFGLIFEGIYFFAFWVRFKKMLELFGDHSPHYVKFFTLVSTKGQFSVEHWNKKKKKRKKKEWSTCSTNRMS